MSTNPIIRIKPDNIIKQPSTGVSGKFAFPELPIKPTDEEIEAFIEIVTQHFGRRAVAHMIATGKLWARDAIVAAHKRDGKLSDAELSTVKQALMAEPEVMVGLMSDNADLTLDQLCEKLVAENGRDKYGLPDEPVAQELTLSLEAVKNHVRKKAAKTKPTK